MLLNWGNAGEALKGPSKGDVSQVRSAFSDHRLPSCEVRVSLWSASAFVHRPASWLGAPFRPLAQRSSTPGTAGARGLPFAATPRALGVAAKGAAFASGASVAVRRLAAGATRLSVVASAAGLVSARPARGSSAWSPRARRAPGSVWMPASRAPVPAFAPVVPWPARGSSVQAPHVLALGRTSPTAARLPATPILAQARLIPSAAGPTTWSRLRPVPCRGASSGGVPPPSAARRSGVTLMRRRLRRSAGRRPARSPRRLVASPSPARCYSQASSARS